MAKYLDEEGLRHLWSNIESKFVDNEELSAAINGLPADAEYTMDYKDGFINLYKDGAKVGEGINAAPFIKDGMLHLNAIKHADGTYTSGRVSTQNKKDFVYGLFECRAKVPFGKGFLPAFWLMSTDENIYGQWPRCGEIDIMEVLGDKPDTLHGTMHFGNPHAQSQGTYVLDGEEDFSNSFHVFQCEWLPGCIRWYVDGILYHEEKQWHSTTEGVGTLPYPAPFNNEFYIILNLAVGGSWVGYPDENTSFDNNPFIIDYVKVYEKNL